MELISVFVSTVPSSRTRPWCLPAPHRSANTGKPMEGTRASPSSTWAFPLSHLGLISSRRAPCGPHLPVLPAPQRLVRAAMTAGAPLAQSRLQTLRCLPVLCGTTVAVNTPSCFHLLSLHLGCPGSRTNLFQPHLLLRGTHHHHHPLNVRHPFPQSHAILGFPLPRRLLEQNPRRKATCRVPKTAT